MTALGVIRERLPFLIDLTTAERVILPKLGDKTQPFVRKAVDIALQHPELLPAGFLDEMRKDAQLLDGLSPILLAIDLLSIPLALEFHLVCCPGWMRLERSRCKHSKKRVAER